MTASVIDHAHDFIDPDTGQSVRAWVIGLKWRAGGEQYGAYYSFSDEPSEDEKAAALHAIREYAAGRVPGPELAA